MTELLSKEKEFLKLNEELDRLTTNVMESSTEHKTRETPSYKSSTAGTTKITESKFLTYQKTKGQSTLLKKRGAGDGTSEVVDINNAITTLKAQRANTLGYNKQTGGETYRTSRQRYDIATSPTSSLASNSPIPTTMPQYRTKPTRSIEPNRSQTHNRINNSRIGPTNTSTFTVKYRNPKYVESPSLEVLVKDECSSLKHPKDSSRISSVASLAIDDPGSTGRRSQNSNNTLASKKNISTDGLIKFLKSKITILEDDHERISEEMIKQKDLLDKALDSSKLIEQQREHAYAKNNALTEQITKIEAQLEEANRHIKERSLEYISQQKELETIKRESKILSQNNTNLEKRLYRANEELENARNALTVMKTSERDQKESNRIDMEAKDKQIKNLKKQRTDLLNAYKKQLFLIDNLKRQNICMEQSKMIAFGEKEFSKVLEWNMKS